MVAETRQRHEWDTLSEFDETALIDALGMRAGRMSRTLPDYNGWWGLGCVFAYRRLIKLFSQLLKVNATNQDPELFLILHLFMC